MKRILSVAVVLLLTLLMVLPAGASHVNPCQEHQLTGTGTPVVKKGAFSLDVDVKEYWTKAGETLTVVFTANGINDTIKSSGGVLMSFKVAYDPAALTLNEKELSESLITLPNGNSDASRADWLKGSDFSHVTNKKTGKKVYTLIAESNAGWKNDGTYAIKKDGEFVLKLEFTVNSGWTGDIAFSVSEASITDNNNKAHNDVEYSFNVKSYSGLLANGNLEGDWVNDVAPTCQSVGHATLRCKLCNEILGIKEVPVTDHTPGAYVEKTKLTCTVDGVSESRCTGCNKLLDTKTVKATGHKAGELKQVKELTCTQDGVWESRCTECNAVVETKTEKAPGHKYGQWEEYSAATVTKRGEERRYCSECGKYETRYTDKLPFEGLRGDMNEDGVLTEADALIIKQMFLGEKTYDAMALVIADSNNNDHVDISDYLYVLRNIK